MKNFNSKTIFDHVCNQMEKLDKKEITIDDAKAQASLLKQANNVLRYELERVLTQIKVEQHIKLNESSSVELRDIEDTSTITNNQKDRK